MNILRSENWQLHGMVEETDSSSFIGSKKLYPVDWKMPVNVVKNAVRKVHKNTTKTDCILVTGGVIRLLDLTEPLEEEIRKLVIGGDVALYWGILKRLGTKKC